MLTYGDDPSPFADGLGFMERCDGRMSGADVGITGEFEGSEMGETGFWRIIFVNDKMKNKTQYSPYPLGACYYLEDAEQRIWKAWVPRNERMWAQRGLWRVYVLFLALRPRLPLHPFV